MEKQQLPACPVETTLTLISDKWKVLILRRFFMVPQTFTRAYKEFFVYQINKKYLFFSCVAKSIEKSIEKSLKIMYTAKKQN